METDTVDALCLKAREAIAQRDPQRARQLYLQALGLKSDSPDVHYGLATVCFQVKELHSAAHHFKEVTRLDPLRAGAFINLGAVCNLLDQVDEAVAMLRRGIQLDPHRAEGYYNLALVYRRKGQVDLAIQAYREALRVNPQMADAHYNVANLFFEKKQNGMAVNHYKQALQLRPNWDKAQNGLAQVEAAQNQARAAVEGVTAAAAPAPATAAVDLDRTVDPLAQGEMLASLHHATIESENYGRQLIKILEAEIEPALKDLSSCLLYPNSPGSELDHCVHKFESAIISMRNAERALHDSMERVRGFGEKLTK